MGKFVEFAEILEGKIRKQLEKEYQISEGAPRSKCQPNHNFHSEIPTYRFESPTYHFSQIQLPKDYLRYRPTPKPFELNESQRRSLERLSQFDRIENPFTPSQLKSAYRKAAKATHPDLQGKPEDFLAVRMAFLDLQKVWKK